MWGGLGRARRDSVSLAYLESFPEAYLPIQAKGSVKLGLQRTTYRRC